MLKFKYTYKYPISAPVDRVGMSITRDQIEPDTIAKLQVLSEQIAVKRYADLTEKKWVVEADPVEFYSASELLKDVPRDGLVAEWLFFEGSGSSLYDTSGNNHHATIYGMTWHTLTTGKIVGSFDGVDDFAELSDWGLGQYDEFTILFWAYRFEEDRMDHVFANNGSGDNLMAVRLGNHTNWQNGRFMIYWGDAATPFTSESKIYKDRWYFIAVTGNVTTQLFRIFINGALDKEGIYAAANKWTATKITIGTWGFSYMKGYIGLLRLYNRTLSESEIKEIYELEAPIFGITP